MISIYLTDDGKLRELEQIVPGAWVHLCAPTEEEVATVCAKLCVEPDLVRAALDELAGTDPDELLRKRHERFARF